MLLVEQLEGHLACNKCCFNNSQPDIPVNNSRKNFPVEPKSKAVVTGSIVTVVAMEAVNPR